MNVSYDHPIGQLKRRRPVALDWSCQPWIDLPELTNRAD